MSLQRISSKENYYSKVDEEGRPMGKEGSDSVKPALHDQSFKISLILIASL